jgi:sugar phosphate isomerase/epimerase
LNDVSGKGPGFGKVAFGPILKDLINGNYSGWGSVEVFEFDCDPQTIASRSIGYLQGILESLGEEISPQRAQSTQRKNNS